MTDGIQDTRFPDTSMEPLLDEPTPAQVLATAKRTLVELCWRVGVDVVNQYIDVPTVFDEPTGMLVRLDGSTGETIRRAALQVDAIKALEKGT